MLLYENGSARSTDRRLTPATIATNLSEYYRKLLTIRLNRSCYTCFNIQREHNFKKFTFLFYPGKSDDKLIDRKLLSPLLFHGCCWIPNRWKRLIDMGSNLTQVLYILYSWLVGSLFKNILC